MAVGYVRPARPDEAAEIARIQLITWRTAYRRLLPRGVLDRLDPDWITERWREAIADPPSARHRVLVAIEQASSPAVPYGAGDRDRAGQLVGFAAAGPADEAALAPAETPGALTGTGALTDLLVEPRWGRRGHGRRLLGACVAGWRRDGLTAAVAWAFQQDVATRRFLASAGWTPDGASRALDVEDLLVPQVRLRTSLIELVEQRTEAHGQPGPREYRTDGEQHTGNE